MEKWLLGLLDPAQESGSQSAISLDCAVTLGSPSHQNSPAPHNCWYTNPHTPPYLKSTTYTTWPSPNTPTPPPWLLTVSHSDAQSYINSQAVQTLPSITWQGQQRWGKSSEFSFRITPRGFHNRGRNMSSCRRSDRSRRQMERRRKEGAERGGETEECKDYSLEGEKSDSSLKDRSWDKWQKTIKAMENREGRGY